MSEPEIIRYCSPTLAGLKTASLFTTPCSNYGLLQDQIRSFNKQLSRKGLRLIPLSMRKERALIYIYRESDLARDILRSASRQILEKLGYTPENVSRSVIHLSRRIRENVDFPHEIGFFLGYPETDVISFMEGRNDYVYAGVWKAYSHAEEARKIVSQYKKCTESYTRQLGNGVPIDRLIVKTS